MHGNKITKNVVMVMRTLVRQLFMLSTPCCLAGKTLKIKMG
jgi:hypothetical protein